MSIETCELTLHSWISFRIHSQFIQLSFFFLLASTTTLLSWRLWRFSISPLFHPEEPRELPYWIPFLGHALSYVSNQDKIVNYGREYFKNTREPFAMTLGPQKLYVMTSYHDQAAVVKNKTTLDYGDIVKGLMRLFGTSEKGVDAVFAPNPSFSENIRRLNPHGKSFFYLKTDFYHTQLHPGKQFNIIQEKVLAHLDHAMRFESMAEAGLIPSKENVKQVPLYKMCQHAFIKAGIMAFFGGRIFQISPSFLDDVIAFDDYHWMLYFEWTGPKVEAMRKPKAKVQAVLEEWLRIPKAQRLGVSWLIDNFEESQRQLGMKESDIAVSLMMMLWVVTTNVYRVTFWMLAYMLHFPSLRSKIEVEIAPSVRPDGSVDLSYLNAEYPHFDSLWFEVLRLTNAAAVLRTVMEPTEIGTKILKSGNKVLSPLRQLHFDPKVFGKGLNEWDPDRFLHNKELSRHPSYKPFGSGIFMCPGRFVARQETFVFIAVLLHRYKAQLGPGHQNFPRFDSDIPTVGLYSPKVGDDVLVRLEEKGATT